MNEKLTIVKVSGKVVEKPEQLRTFVKSFAMLEGAKLLIFSGNNMAESVGNRMNLKTKKVDSRPVVDDVTRKLLVMVYAGQVLNQLVALLQSFKVRTLGVTGADLNLITSVKWGDGSLGATGQVKQVNTVALRRLLEAGVVPVFAPITHDGHGNLLFNETDAMAAEIAKSLALRYDVKLIYCFERNGVLLDVDNPDSVISALKRTQYKSLRDMGIINDWFVNKLDNAYSAIDHGVKEVVITNVAHLGDDSSGTHIVKNPRPSAPRPAK